MFYQYAQVSTYRKGSNEGKVVNTLSKSIVTMLTSAAESAYSSYMSLRTGPQNNEERHKYGKMAPQHPLLKFQPPLQVSPSCTKFGKACRHAVIHVHCYPVQVGHKNTFAPAESDGHKSTQLHQPAHTGTPKMQCNIPIIAICSFNLEMKQYICQLL